MKRMLIVFFCFLLFISTVSCGVAEHPSLAEHGNVVSSDTGKTQTNPELPSECETEPISSMSETEEFPAPETAGSEEGTMPETSETKPAGQEAAASDPDLSLYRVELNVNEDKDFAYFRDVEGNALGAADYWIDGDYAYILSTSSNTITVFQHQEAIRKISFENGRNGGMNLLRFAVKEDVAYAFAVNSSDSCLIKYVNWEPAARMSIYDFTRVEGFFDFYIKDEDLYVVSLSDETFEYMTCLIHEEDGKLVCFEKHPGKIVDGSYFENHAAVCSALKKVTASQAEKDHFVFVEQLGTADCGTDGDGGHYYFSSEIVRDEAKEYLIQRIYHFDAEGRLLETNHIPADVTTNNLQPVKIFYGTPWTLYLSEESVALLPLEEAAESYDLLDSMLEIDWS